MFNNISEGRGRCGVVKWRLARVQHHCEGQGSGLLPAGCCMVSHVISLPCQSCQWLMNIIWLHLKQTQGTLLPSTHYIPSCLASDVPGAIYSRAD